jgi:hypothetical protein
MTGRSDDTARPPAGPRAVSESDQLDNVLARLRAEVDRPVAKPLIDEWAAVAAHAAATTGRPGWRQRKAGAPTAARKRRLATAVSAAVLLIGGASGLAWAANSSAPGDALYGLDRTLERVGIGRGGVAERLQEVRGLVEVGDVPGGLSHAGELVGEVAQGATSDASYAAEALRAAATRVASQGSEASAEVRNQVADLLTYLAENAGQVDDRKVASLAQEIAGNADPAGPEPLVSIAPADPEPPISIPPVDPGPPLSVPPDDELPSFPADPAEIDDGKPWMPVG